MKITKLLWLFVITILLSSCSDDDDKELEKTTDDLIYTSWKGEVYGPDYKGDILRENIILQFLSPTEGQFIRLDEQGKPLFSTNGVSYKFNGPVISFQGAITGQWTITKKTSKHLRLEAYTPYQNTMDLERVF